MINQPIVRARHIVQNERRRKRPDQGIRADDKDFSRRISAGSVDAIRRRSFVLENEHADSGPEH
jgi:hypothetical protein